MNKISIHDHEIESFSVLIREAKITLRTGLPKIFNGKKTKEFTEKVEVVFTGVLAYLFINLNTIILDIDECSLDYAFKETGLFTKDGKYRWPESWNQSPEKAFEYLSIKNAKAWHISTSYGESAFIIAKKIEYLKEKRVC